MSYFWRVAVLGFVLSLGLPIRAQNGSVFTGKAYKPVPSYAYARVPKGGHSRFYGSDRLGTPRNEEVRVHFYYWPEVISPSADKSEKESQSQRSYRVDVFVRKLQKKAQFHLVQSVDIPSKIFNGIEPAMETVRYGVQWLTPKKRVTPMIHLQIYNNGFYGPYGTDITLVFPKDWAVKPVVQGFVFHGDHYDAVRSDFSLDENGTVQIARVYQSNDVPDKAAFWKWNGQRFSPEKTSDTTTPVSHKPRA